MSKPSLEGVDAKIRRAKAHIAEFKKLVDGAVNGSGYHFAFDADPEGGYHVYRVYDVPKIDPDWSLVAGDCIHNLRSALDHLAWQLVRLDGKNDPTCDTQFPLRQFPCNKKGVYVPPEIWPKITRADIRELVKKVQPYMRIDGQFQDARTTYLWALARADIVDKHRLLLAVNCVFDTSGMGWTWEGDSSPVAGNIRINNSALQNGSPAAWFKFVGEEPPADFDPHPSIQVTIRDAEVPLLSFTSAYNALEVLAFTVEDEVVRLFRPLFA